MNEWFTVLTQEGLICIIAKSHVVLACAATFRRRIAGRPSNEREDEVTGIEILLSSGGRRIFTDSYTLEQFADEVLGLPNPPVPPPRP